MRESNRAPAHLVSAMVTKPAPQSWPRHVLGFIVGEFLGAFPSMLFFAVGFNVVVLSMNLIVDDYLIRFGGFMTATAAALIVGKGLLGNKCFKVVAG